MTHALSQDDADVDDEDLDREVGEIASFAGLTIIPDTIPSPPEEGRNNP